MKWYGQLAQMGTFSRDELTRTLQVPYKTVDSLIYNYRKKQYIDKIRPDRYVALSFETPGTPMLNRYQIASQLFPDAVVAYHSALEVHGLANQIYNVVYLFSKHRFKPFDYDSVQYIGVIPKVTPKTQSQNKITVTTLEQTVIDSIDALEKISGVEEIYKAMEICPSLDPDEILEILDNYHNKFLYQKTGYILESFNSNLNLPDWFFSECYKHIGSSKKPLVKDETQYPLNKRWRVYAQPVRDALSKGVPYDLDLR